MSSKLTPSQIGRQDYVDNAIHNLLSELNPNSFEDLRWDIEAIGRVRDEIEQILVREKHVCTEIEFYPYIITE